MDVQVGHLEFFLQSGRLEEIEKTHLGFFLQSGRLEPPFRGLRLPPRAAARLARLGFVRVRVVLAFELPGRFTGFSRRRPTGAARLADTVEGTLIQLRRGGTRVVRDQRRRPARRAVDVGRIVGGEVDVVVGAEFMLTRVVDVVVGAVMRTRVVDVLLVVRPPLVVYD